MLEMASGSASTDQISGKMTEMLSGSHANSQSDVSSFGSFDMIQQMWYKLTRSYFSAYLVYQLSGLRIKLIYYKRIK